MRSFAFAPFFRDDLLLVLTNYSRVLEEKLWPYCVEVRLPGNVASSVLTSDQPPAAESTLHDEAGLGYTFLSMMCTHYATDERSSSLYSIII